MIKFGNEEIKKEIEELKKEIFEIKNSIEEIKKRLYFIGIAEIYFDDRKKFENFLNLCATIYKKDRNFVFDADNEKMIVRIFSITRGTLISKLSWILNNTDFKDLNFKIL
ncbi:MAG: hypothetical protein KQA34_02895 [Candidatus Aenigmarchaeota archaeon]|nr:hypothetical protein [Candidatus Aenigmarchaeota archaeon]